MKILIWACLFLTSLQSDANEAVGGAPSSPASAPKAHFTALEFLAPITEARRPPPAGWPKSITVQSVPTQSLEDFKTQIAGTWSVVYHCAGSAMSAEEMSKNGLFDGWKSQGVQVSISETTLTQRLITPGRLLKHQRTEIRRGSVKFAARGDNWFLLSAKGEFADTLVVRSAKIAETGEIVFELEEASYRIPCGNHKFVRAMFVPTPSA